MTDADRKPFVLGLTAVAEALSAALPSGPGLEVWWRLLRRYELQPVLAALEAHVADPEAGRFFPKPADIFRQIEMTLEDRASLAWAHVCLLLRDTRQAKARISDPMAEQAVEAMGGWRALGMAQETDIRWLERSFRQFYRACAQREQFLAIRSGEATPLLKRDNADEERQSREQRARSIADSGKSKQ